MKKLVTYIGMGIISMGLLAGIVSARSDCTWTVSGTIKTKTQDGELVKKFGEIIPLKGVQVKISGATVGDIFDSWGPVKTNSNGEYTVTKQKNCSDRKLKIEIQFQNDNLELRVDFPSNPVSGVVSSPPKWYLAIQDENFVRRAGHIQIVPIIFDTGKNHDLSLREARDHADLWIIANSLRDHLTNMGPKFAFTQKSVIEYPYNDPLISDDAEASFCNPADNVVNIFRSRDGKEDHLSVGGVFHEMMHSWTYKHTSGELDLATNLIFTGSTHCFNDQQQNSFNEAFAEFSSERSEEAIYGIKTSLPFNRDALNEGLACEAGTDRIRSMSDMERHEYGWMSLFRMLTTGDLYTYTYAGEATSTSRFNSSVFIKQNARTAVVGTCAHPTDKHLKDILDVFLPHPEKGFPKNLAKSEMTIDSFMNRSAKIMNFEAQKAGLKHLLDPARTTEPKDELCSLSTFQPPRR